MPNFYTSRERLKSALTVAGSDKNAVLDAHIEGASRSIERELGRRFIPKTQQRLFRWPQDESSREIWSPHDDRPGGGAYQILRLDEDLLSASAITSENGDLTLVAGDYFLEPASEGPPYTRIEINAASANATALFAAKTTVQRAIAVTGSWGYGNDTEAAGTLSASIANGTVATCAISDASLVDVGDTLLIESEQIFVTKKSVSGAATTLSDALAVNVAETAVTVANGAAIKTGEVIVLDSEQMYVQAVSGNILTVIRAHDGTVLAAHAGADTVTVYVFRSLTIVRGVNGTTAASHASAVAITRYRVPGPIESLCRAEAIFNYEQDESGQTGVVGGPEGGVNVRPRSLEGLWERAKCGYMRPLSRVL